MITKTSLMHPTMRAKIDKAMREAARFSSHPSLNKCGFSVIGKIETGIYVVHFRGEFRAFQFFTFTPKGKYIRITDTVLSILRSTSCNYF